MMLNDCDLHLGIIWDACVFILAGTFVRAANVRLALKWGRNRGVSSTRPGYKAGSSDV